MEAARVPEPCARPRRGAPHGNGEAEVAWEREREAWEHLREQYEMEDARRDGDGPRGMFEDFGREY